MAEGYYANIDNALANETPPQSLREMSLEELVEEGMQHLNFIVDYAPSVVGALIFALIGNCIANCLVRIVRNKMQGARFPTSVTAMKRQSTKFMARTRINSMQMVQMAQTPLMQGDDSSDDEDAKNEDNYGKFDETVVHFSMSCLNVSLKAMVVVAALAMMGVHTSSLLAVFAATSLAFGLSLQNVIEDAAKGAVLITFKPFHVGDMVRINDIQGRIREVGVLNTVLLTPDNQLHILPNRNVVTVTNLTIMGTFRLDVPFKISVDEDFNRVRKMLLQMMDSHALPQKDPAPEIQMNKIGEDGIAFSCRCWVLEKDILDWPAACNEATKEIFVKNKVKCPRDVWTDPGREGLEWQKALMEGAKRR